MFKPHNHVMVMLISVILIACAKQPTVTMEQATSEAGEVHSTLIVSTETPTLPPTVTPKPTSTIRPTSTPILPTPVLPEWALDDFLFGNASPSCNLPCWQGLRVNESTGDDVQEVFDATFNFNGMKDFAVKYPESGYLNETDTALGRSHQWIFGEEPLRQLTAGVWLDRESHLLKALDFMWSFSPDRTHVEMTAKKMLQKLGLPSYWLVRVELTERADQGNLAMMMLYDFGLFYGAELHIPILEQGDNYIAEFCLDNSRKNWISGSILMMEPFANNLTPMTPLQSELLGEPYDRSTPIDEMFGMTIEEMSTKVLSEEQTCFYTKPLLP